MPKFEKLWRIRFQSNTSDGITARSMSVILRLKIDRENQGAKVQLSEV